MSATAPEIPFLSVGDHVSPGQGSCLVELASLLAGEEWSSAPDCVHPTITRTAQMVNDNLDEHPRQKLLPLLPRLLGTASTDVTRSELTIDVGLTLWLVDHLLRVEVQAGKETDPLTRASLDLLRTWLTDQALLKDVTRVRNDLFDAPDDRTDVIALHAAAVLARITLTHRAVNGINDVRDELVQAKHHLLRATDDLVDSAVLMTPPEQRADLLVGLLTEYDHLSGRETPPPLTSEQMVFLTEAMA